MQLAKDLSWNVFQRTVVPPLVQLRREAFMLLAYRCAPLRGHHWEEGCKGGGRGDEGMDRSVTSAVTITASLLVLL